MAYGVAEVRPKSVDRFRARAHDNKDMIVPLSILGGVGAAILLAALFA